MAEVTFASRLKDDGSLAVPKHAVEELGIRPGDHVRVRVEAANENGARTQSTTLSRARQAMTHRTPEQIAEAQARAMETYQPLRTVPPGKTHADIVSGEWPGNETDEEIEAEVRAAIAEVKPDGPKGFGQVMKAATARMSGRADGSQISGVVRRLLGS